LPVRATPAEPAPATDLADFKPRRRVAGEDRVLPHPDPLPPEEGTAPDARLRSKRAPTSPSRTASPPLPAGEGRGEGERIGNPPSGQRRSAPARTRRLIVNADDFGRSHSINQAVIRAHREGILTTTSLMVNGDACAEAVELAKQNPALGVGLHLTLVCGKSACDRLEIPDLVNPLGGFSDSPVAAGMRYFFSRGLRLQLAREIAAQFAKFKATGLVLDHVNGHLNLHLHPTIFELLASRYQEWGIRRLRVTDDPYALNRRLARGQWFYRASHAFIFRRLSARARRILAHSDIRFTDHVFGLLQNARVDERYITRLLPELPRGDSELYSHPSLDEFRHEFDALVSPRVKALVAEENIQLIRYQDL
jgi:chitin disaccharide deacetylase